MRLDSRVPGDQRAPSAIAWVGKHHRHMRKLKRGRGEDELTGMGLAAVSSSLRWRKLDLGGIGNSCVLVDDRGWERVLQLHDDMAQLRARSIYSASGRWPRISSKTRGGRRERRTLAQVNSWQTAWQSPRRRWDSLKVSRWCGGKAKPRGTWPGGGGHRRGNPCKPQSSRGRRR